MKNFEKYTSEEKEAMYDQTFGAVDETTFYFSKTVYNNIAVAFYRDLSKPFSEDAIDLQSDEWIPVGACFIDDEGAAQYLQNKAIYNVLIQTISDYPEHLQDYIRSWTDSCNSPMGFFYYRIGETDKIDVILGNNFQEMAAAAKVARQITGVIQIPNERGIQIFY